MRNWLLAAAILGCLLIELVHPVLTRAGAHPLDPAEILLDTWDVRSAHGSASMPMPDLFEADIVSRWESFASLRDSVGGAPATSSAVIRPPAVHERGQDGTPRRGGRPAVRRRCRLAAASS